MHMHMHMHTHMHMHMHMHTCTHAHAHALAHDTCLSSQFAPDQEPDDFLVAQNTPLPPEAIMGFAGDAV